jgi:hypothetical protein
VGVPGAYDYGPERVSWLGHLVTNWMGDAGVLRRLNVQVQRHNLIGDTTWCRGEVTGKEDDGSVELRVHGGRDRHRRPAPPRRPLRRGLPAGDPELAGGT